MLYGITEKVLCAFSNESHKKGGVMKKTGIMVVGMVLAAICAFGSISAEAAETSGSASVDVMSSYMWRGFELYEDAALQPSAGITYGGFGANLWADYNTDPGEAVETDLTLNYSFSVDKFSFDAGYIYYALDGAEDTQEVYQWDTMSCSVHRSASTMTLMKAKVLL